MDSRQVGMLAVGLGLTLLLVATTVTQTALEGTGDTEQQLWFGGLHPCKRGAPCWQKKVMASAAKEAAKSLAKEKSIEVAFKDETPLRKEHSDYENDLKYEKAEHPQLQILEQTEVLASRPAASKRLRALPLTHKLVLKSRMAKAMLRSHSIKMRTTLHHPGGVLVIHNPKGLETSLHQVSPNPAVKRAKEVEGALQELSQKQIELAKEERELKAMKTQIALAEQEYKQQRALSLAQKAKVVSSEHVLSILHKDESTARHSLDQMQHETKSLQQQQLQLSARNAALEQEISSESLQKHRAIDALRGEKRLEGLYLEQKADTKRVSQELAYEHEQAQDLRKRLAAGGN
jgi:hypothetical protein